MATKKNSNLQPEGRVTLPGSERSRPASSKLLGELDPQENLSVIVRVRQRPGSPPLPDHEYYMKHRPGQRKVYSAEEFAATFGASQRDLDAVAAFAKANGMSIEESHAGKRHVAISGTAAAIGKAFGITLKKYEAPVPKAPGRTKNKDQRKAKTEAPKLYTHHGFDGDVQLPAELDGVVTAVIGLADHRLGYPAAGTGDPTSNPPYLTSAQCAQYYNFPNTGAVGQTIGIFAGDEAAYLSTDITTYIKNLQTGYNTQPVLHDIDLKVNGTTYSNDPSLASSDNGAAVELALDISTSAGISQGATINIYFTTDSEAGWYAFLQEAMFRTQQPSANLPCALTSSWIFNRDDSVANVGDYTKSGSSTNSLTGLFQQAGAFGITVFMAVGDNGADDGIGDGNPHVQYCATDPWVTTCGGTVLGFNGAANWSPADAGPEWVWSDAQGVGEFGGIDFGTPDFGATGGGVSTQFPMPPWQVSAGIPAPNPVNAGSYKAPTGNRGVPDVAAMVAHNNIYISGTPIQVVGTSAVAPMYAGLTSVLNKGLGFVPATAGNPQKGQAIGFLNPFLYEFGNSVCNDVTVGNNDSGDSPDSPYYKAGTGWDYCTGWGSIDGKKVLTALSNIYGFYFVVDKNTYGLDEVNDNANKATATGTSAFPNAFWLVLENFTPNNLGATPSVNFSGAFYGIPNSTNFNSIPPLSPVSPDTQFIWYEFGVNSSGQPNLPDMPQRIQLAYDVQFTTLGNNPSLQAFPAAGSTSPNYYQLGASITVDGKAYHAETEFELTGGADPYFTNVNPGVHNYSYLSQDLQVFTANENPAANPFNALPGAPQFSPKIANSHSTNLTGTEVNNAYSYVRSLIGFLNTNYQTADSAKDPFAALYNAGSLDNFSTVAPVDSAGNWNFSFAIARVRLLDNNTAATAPNVKVFFRLWNTMATDTDFKPYDTFLSSDKNNNPISGPGNTNPPEFPLVGAGDTTFPFFATGNNGAGNDYGANGINNQALLNTSGKEQWYYFGCFLNVYDLANVPTGQSQSIPKSLNGLLTGTHDCLVAQIACDDTPLLNSGGVTLTTNTCDKLAQRNINFTPSGNPGGAEAHKVPQTFDLRPSAAIAQAGTGDLLDYPDELMIEWGDVPPGSIASIYWPQVNSGDVLDLASRLYATNTLSAADAHTVQCTTVKGITYVPIPSGSGQNFAGLFTIDLPYGTHGVKAGQKFEILVRRVSTRRANLPDRGDTNATTGRGNLYSMQNWRYVVGIFQLTILVNIEEALLKDEENTLAIMKWRLEQTSPTNRWHPVLLRYISYLEGRVNGFGGNASNVPASNIGFLPLTPINHGGYGDEFTGKVGAVIFDRFGDFEGFRLLTEFGHEEEFYSRESEIGALVARAWEERIVISVITEREHRHLPVKIIYRRMPNSF